MIVKPYPSTGRRSRVARATVLSVLISTIVATAAFASPASATETIGADPAAVLGQRQAPDYDFNIARALSGTRVATASQRDALAALKTATGATALTARWNAFGGSPEVMYDFASAPYAGTPEQAARAFIAQHATLFGVASDGDLHLASATAAMGGQLVRFQQTFNGVPVNNGGIGVVLNADNQVIMVSGPFFRDVAVSTQPTLSAAQAVSAAEADIARFHVAIPTAVTDLQEPGLEVLNQQVEPTVAKIQPTLWVYPTADGYRLAWKVAKYGNNPFGLFEVAVDAHSGEILSRKDHVAYQSLPPTLPPSPTPLATLPGQETADIFPTYPQIDASLKEQSVISTCTTDGRQHPCGQQRVVMRLFDAGNRTSGVNGTLTGPNAIVNNALASKLPFSQAGLGTWHFSKDDPAALEARTNEADQFAEPAEHQDDINAFFFVNYNKEYVDHLHIAGDNNAFGGGAFPDQYQGKGLPISATVHIPNISIALNVAANCSTDDPVAFADCTRKYVPDPTTDPAALQKILGLDNAMAVQLTSIYRSVTGVNDLPPFNPTIYGHGGELFNDLALDGMVAYHETMHSTSSPIAGFEGEEGGHLNEGQADMWSYTMADYTSIGDYVVAAKGFHDLIRSRGIDPAPVSCIRSARSTGKYSQFYNRDDTHWGGEIYATALWDVREMLNRVYPQATTYKRPAFQDGKLTRPITVGTHVFERDFLGSMYLLGAMAPDTLVKARDALIVADQMLYPSSADPAAPGLHRALIEQAFAAKELGINAREASAGKVTISTQVSRFAGGQAAPAVPTNVTWTQASANSLRVSWKPVPGAIASQVLKRKTALAGQRDTSTGDKFIDGDAWTTGFRHAYFVAGNQTSFEDKGRQETFFTTRGLDSLTGSEYAVRAIGVNTSGQLGWSDLSAKKKGSQSSDGVSDPPLPAVYAVFTETKTGTLLAGDPSSTGGESATWGDPAFKGITWEDVPVTTTSDALVLEAALSSITAPDLDFEVRTTDGQVLGRSAGATAAEFVSTAVQPNTTYILRVLGFANGPSTFQIVARQMLPEGSPNANTTETVTK